MKKKILFTFLVLIMCLPAFLANASDFTVTDLSLPGGVIESDHGSIEITFSAPVDATTKDEIKLLKTDGGEIPGGSYVTLSPDSMKAVLVYGRLYEGEYKLIGTERLLSEDGESLTPFEITYIVPVSVPEIKVYEANFEKLSTGSISVSNISAQVPGTSCGTGGGNATYSIGESESGIKYLSVKTSKKNTGASLSVTLSEAIEKGKVYVDMKMMVTEGTLTRNMFQFADGNGSSTALRMVQYINTDQGIRNDGAGIGCDVLKKMPDKDDDGFFNLRLCMERNTTEDKWTAVCYDMNSTDRDIIFKSRQPFNNISSIQKIIVLEIYPTSDTEAEEAVYVSDIKVSTHAEPELLYIEGDFLPDAEKIKTVLTEDTDMIDAEFYTRDGEKFDAEITLDEIDAVYIASPVFCHKEQAIKAAKAKKHILLEKPIALSTEEAKEIKVVCEENNVKISIGFLMRFHGYHQKIKEIIETGKLGQIVSMRGQFTCWYPEIEGAWRQKKSLSGGGALMDMGIHVIDILQYLSGLKAVEVAGFTQTQTFAYEVDDSANIIMRMENGSVAYIDSNFNIPDEASVAKLEIYGTKGSIVAIGTLAQEETGKVDILISDNNSGYDANQNRTQLVPFHINDAVLGNMYTKEIDGLCDAISKGMEVPVPIEEAIYDQKIAEAAYISSHLSKFIAVNDVNTI